MKAHKSQTMPRITALIAVLTAVVIGAGSSTFQVAGKSHSHSSITGYFGLEAEGLPIVDRHGIMLVFDGPIAPETVSASTFEVYLDENTQGNVVDARVDGAYVFLMLSEELASNATPILMIAEGEEVEDLAGNSTNRRKLGAVRIKDGISPNLTVSLSGGSGLGTGDEGPSRLTNKMIDIRIESDEPLQGAPRIVVVCSELSWTGRTPKGNIKRDIDDFIANRSGPFAQKPSEPPGTVYTCGYDDDGDGKDDVFEPTELIARSRPGEVWEYTWQNLAGAATRLQDGELAVVAFGKDRSRYERHGETVSNWATAKGGFGLDTQFVNLGINENVKVFPEHGSVTRENRPFIMIEFLQTDMVMLTSVRFDGIEIVGEFETPGANRFVYWPLSMKRGKHEVEAEAQDSAGNALSFDFSFESALLGDFVLDLHPGWNAISLPSWPTDSSIGAIFTDPSIKSVIGYSDGEWRLAVRGNGVWERSAQYEALTRISPANGYWVKSTGFVHQPVSLQGFEPPQEPLSMLGDTVTSPGWNFVGVVDVGGDQVEDHFGETLRDSDHNPLPAREYLGNDYQTAYTWNPLSQRFERLLPDDPMTIGDGVWVYYGDADGIAP